MPGIVPTWGMQPQHEFKLMISRREVKHAYHATRPPRLICNSAVTQESIAKVCSKQKLFALEICCGQSGQARVPCSLLLCPRWENICWRYTNCLFALDCNQNQKGGRREGVGGLAKYWVWQWQKMPVGGRMFQRQNQRWLTHLVSSVIP